MTRISALHMIDQFRLDRDLAIARARKDRDQARKARERAPRATSLRNQNSRRHPMRRRDFLAGLGAALVGGGLATAKAEQVGTSALATSVLPGMKGGTYVDGADTRLTTDIQAAIGGVFNGTSNPLSFAAANLAFPTLKLSGAGTIETDAAAIQEFLNRGVGYGSFRPAAIPVLGGFQIVLDGSKTAKGLKGAPGGTVIYCQTPSGSSALQIQNYHGGSIGRSGGNAYPVPLIDITLDARSGQGGGGNTIPVSDGNGGYNPTPHTNYAVGTSPMLVHDCFNGGWLRVGWQGFDQPIQMGSNWYCWDHVGGQAENNNLGGGWATASGAQNSGERMGYRGVTFSNNNVGFYVSVAGGVGCDAYIVQCSGDYNNVAHLQMSDTTHLYSNLQVFIVASHWENASVVYVPNTTTIVSGCGTNPRFQVTDGYFEIRDVELLENSPVPPRGIVGFETADGSSGQIEVSALHIYGSAIPVCYQADTNTHDFDCSGCTYRYPNTPVIAYSSPNGLRMQRTLSTVHPVISQNTFPMDATTQGKAIPLDPSGVGGGVIYLQFDDDAIFNHEIGSMFGPIFIVAGGAGGGGVSGNGNTKVGLEPANDTTAPSNGAYLSGTHQVMYVFKAAKYRYIAVPTSTQ